MKKPFPFQKGTWTIQFPSLRFLNVDYIKTPEKLISKSSKFHRPLPVIQYLWEIYCLYLHRKQGGKPAMGQGCYLLSLQHRMSQRLPSIPYRLPQIFHTVLTLSFIAAQSHWSAGPGQLSGSPRKPTWRNNLAASSSANTAAYLRSCWGKGQRLTFPRPWTWLQHTRTSPRHPSRISSLWARVQHQQDHHLCQQSKYAGILPVL